MRSLLVACAIVGGDLGSLLAHAQSCYDNPVDKKTYVTGGEFKTYQPVAPRNVRGQRVTTEGVVLLTGEPDLKTRISVKELVAFIQDAEKRAYVELARNETAMMAMVQFDCRPADCTVKLASQGEAADATLQGLYNALSQMPPLKPRGDVAFQVKFKVGG